MRARYSSFLWFFALNVFVASVFGQGGGVPVVSVSPTNQIGYLGGAVSFDVSASGAAPISYQWQKEGHDLPGATLAQLRLTGLDATSAGSYRVLVSNTAGTVPSSAASLAIHRMELDADFNLEVTAPSGNTVTGLLPRANGGVYVSGGFTAVEGRAAPWLVRLFPDGTRDPGFTSTRSDTVPLVEFPDGRLLVKHTVFSSSGSIRLELCILGADGTLAPNFSISVGATYPSTADVSAARWSNGGVLLAGTFSSLNGIPRAGLARLLGDGSVDASYAPSVVAKSTALLPDGRAFVATSTGLLVRLLADGTVDPAFAPASYVGPLGTPPYPALWGLADGGVLASPWRVVQAAGVEKVVRFKADGTQDSSYVSPPILTGSNAGQFLAVEPDGNALASAQGRLYRVTSTGTAVVLADDWMLKSSIYDDHAWALPAGGFILSGAFSASIPTHLRWVSSTGIVDHTRLVGLGYAGGISWQAAAPGGQTYLAGTFAWLNGQRRSKLARLRADGSVDSDYAPNAALLDGLNAQLLLADGAVLLAPAPNSATSMPWRRVESDGRIELVKDLVFNGIVSGVSAAPDGSAFVAGTANTVNGASRRALTRIWPGGAGLDPGYPAALASAAGTMRIGHAPDGRFVLSSEPSQSPTGKLTWYLANGLADPDRPVIAYTGKVSTLRFAADQSLYVAGFFSAFGPFAPGPMVRISPAGVIDSSFAASSTLSFVEPTASPPSFVVLPGGRLTFVPYIALTDPSGPLWLTSWGDVDSGFAPVLTPAASGLTVAGVSPAALTVAGQFTSADGVTRRGLARYRDPAALRVTFPSPVEVRVSSVATSLSLTVSGVTAAPTFEWRREGVAVAGGSAQNLTLSSPSSADSGHYTVRVTADGQTVEAGPILLQVTTAGPALIRQPQAVSGAEGSTIDLSVGAVGLGVVSYQWQRNGVDLAGATDAVLHLTGLRTSDAGDYRVIVRDSSGSVASATVPVTTPSWRVDEAFRPVVATLGTPSYSDNAIATALGLPDGKMLVGGGFSAIDGESHAYLVRYDTNGRFDPTFDLAPGVTGPITQLWRRPDGRVLALGTNLVALTADGRLDPSFTLDPAVPKVTAADLLPDGRIDVVFTTLTSNPIAGPFSRARLLASGQLDPSVVVASSDSNVLPIAHSSVPLSDGGTLRLSASGVLQHYRADGSFDSAYLPPSFDVATIRGLFTDATGRIYVSGDFRQCDGVAAEGIVRLRADGTFDQTLNTNTGYTWRALGVAGDGRMLVQTASPNSYPGYIGEYIWVSSALQFEKIFQGELRSPTPAQPMAAAALADGRVYAAMAGVTLNGESIPGTALVRLDAAGHRDPTFTPPALGGTVSQILPLPSGQIIVLGGFTLPSEVQFRSGMRLNSDGTVDTTWPALYIDIRSAAIDSLGRFVAVQSSGVIRLLAGGAVDSSFTGPNLENDSGGRPMALTSDNRVLLVARPKGESTARLLRLNENGTIDPTFNPALSISAPVAINVLTDGRIVMHNQITSSFVSPFLILRSDGSADSAPASVPNGPVLQVKPTPDGGYLFSGAFSTVGGVTRQRLAHIKADGSVDDAFQIPGPALSYSSGSFSSTFSLTVASNGDVLVWGPFLDLAGLRTHHLARLTTVPFDVRVPSARTVVAPGDTATLAVTPTGNGPFSYQWKKGGATIASATGPALSLTASTADAGDYICEVTVAGQTRASAPMTLAIGRAPRITAAPLTPTIVRSAGATLSVAFDSDTPATIAWYVDGVPLPIASANTPSVAITPQSQGITGYYGIYEVRITNAFGTARAAATVLGGYAPAITAQPTALTATAGTAAALAFSASGVPTSPVKWFRDGQPVGARARVSFNGQVSLVFNELIPSDSGSYTARIDTPFGSVTTAPALLTVVPLPGTGVPVFTTQPASQVRGATIGFNFSAIATGAVSYQWLKDGVPLPNATQTTYSKSFISSSDQGAYRLQAANSFGSALSDPATLTLSAAPVPLIGSSQPYVAQPGSSFTLNATAVSPLPVTYQWYKDTTLIPGATSATLTFASVQASDAAPYHVVATNAYGSQTGSYTTVTVATTPSAFLLAGVGRLATGVGTDEVFGTFWIEGTAARPVLVRALGASLAALGVDGGMADPQLQILSPAGVVLASNDDWGTAANLSDLQSAMVSAGAVPSQPAAKDAAILITLPPGPYHYRVRPSGTTTGGIVLAEIYSAPDYTVPGSVSRIAGLTLRTQIATSSGVAVLGFTVPSDYGTIPLRPALLRAGGPVLGVGGVSPEIEFYGASSELLARDSGGAQTDARATAAAQLLGLVPFASGGADASALVTLSAAGPYTLLVRPKNATSGYVLIESQSTDGFRDATRAPAIVSPPLPQITTAGGSTIFQAGWVAKPAPTTFQWLKDGQPLSGATQPTLTLAGVQPSDAGQYTLSLASPLGTAVSLPATLTVRPAEAAHSADSNGDFQISLFELTRVIALYNVRLGSVRTGAYKVDANGEDGFAIDPERPGATTLTRYHTADTSHDGRLSLSELTRVIELYNVRGGSTRTGAYHAQAGTEDGFATGP